MQVEVASAWEGLVSTLIKNGRYASTAEVVEDGLRLVQERERKLAWLRGKVQHALAEGGDLTDGDIGDALDEAERRLSGQGD